jgi:hypothetical protein
VSLSALCFPRSASDAIVPGNAMIESGEDVLYSVGHPFDCSLVHHEGSPLGTKQMKSHLIQTESGSFCSTALTATLASHLIRCLTPDCHATITALASLDCTP